VDPPRRARLTRRPRWASSARRSSHGLNAATPYAAILTSTHGQLVAIGLAAWVADREGWCLASALDRGEIDDAKLSHPRYLRRIARGFDSRWGRQHSVFQHRPRGSTRTQRAAPQRAREALGLRHAQRRAANTGRASTGDISAAAGAGRGSTAACLPASATHSACARSASRRLRSARRRLGFAPLLSIATIRTEAPPNPSDGPLRCAAASHAATSAAA
jgi:hypothetical protein